MQIDRLRLVGFKSFADAAEVAIGPGLTGIVGPNGCGKSNLAEALRWVMGENSARRLRGGAMDDMIFGGAAGRPARNLAEVVLSIDNRARDAPFAFNDREEIEIIRRIERGGGSAWRVNGREVRARDVQLLFADAGTGGPSAAIVSQGRVGALIEAKPAERRFLLEEAAGTAGLHARRHETEARLTAAEDNLARLDDVIATLAAQLGLLNRQARQAQRYRRLGEEIRRHQALLLDARWRAATAAAERRVAELGTAEVHLAAAERCAAIERLARDEAEGALPQRRAEEAAAAAELQRQTQIRGALEQELARSVAARREAERRLAELARDGAREEAQLGEAEAALARLGEECCSLAAAAAESVPERAVAGQELEQAAARLAAAEAELQRAVAAAAVAAAQRGALERRRRELAERRARLDASHAAAERRHAACAAAAIPAAASAAAAAAVGEAEGLTEGRRAVLEAAQPPIAARQQHENAALTAARQAAARLARLEAEAEALEALAASDGLAASAGDAGGDAPILSEICVAEGFETAVGAVFGDELSASVGDGDDGAARFWLELAAISGPPALPEGARPLAEAVVAPGALGRSLAFTGWVDSAAEGCRLQPCLAPGQRLVDRDGHLWRWDGFTRLAAGGSAAAERLRYKNRLAILSGEIAAAAAATRSAEAAAAVATAARREASEADRLAGARLREAEAALAKARAGEAELARRALNNAAQLAVADETLVRLIADLTETQADTEDIEQQLAGLPEPAPVRSALDAAHAAAARARRDDAEARAAIDRLTRQAHSRRERLTSIDREQRSWRQRGDGASAQGAALRERRGALEREIAELAARPAAIAAAAETLGAEITTAAQHRRQAADRLALDETRLRDAAERSRLAIDRLAEARERCARLDGQSEGAGEALAALGREIRERIGCAPAELAGLAGLGDGRAPPETAATAARLERLARERDGIGPVNLAAESEAAAIGARVDALARERTDLTEAVAKLRRGGNALDDEGRRLLAAAFERINRHFGALFARLFGGGKAELALTEDGDLLTAGLEIMASPTGKRLQTLSLLSGGEQALTALALLFAVFLTRPAPICVLDEVDAPLDDANVDRLCGLVAEIADTTGTRFLLVTHHRITMARADRLFGVTMAERGVSQLVSVDLARAVRLRQTA